MLDHLLTYALTVYLSYHVASRSELLRRPREWARAHLPRKLTYPLQCSLCWSWWCGLAITVALWLSSGILMLSASILFAAPVFNMVLDLAVRALIKANEPQALALSSNTASGCNNSSGAAVVSIPTMWSQWGTTPGTTPVYTSFGPYPDPVPSHVGRRARVVRGHWDCRGKEGVIIRHFVDNDDCSGTFQKECYDIPGAYFKVAAADCDLLDEPLPPSTASIP